MFQFTRPQGARHILKGFNLQVNLFQFTRPQGARLVRHVNRRQRASFNSRAHKGRDVMTQKTRDALRIVSIHAPTRGATLNVHIRYFSYIVSIHAPTRGATLQFLNDFLVIKVSIHAPTRGATFSTSTSVGC